MWWAYHQVSSVCMWLNERYPTTPRARLANRVLIVLVIYAHGHLVLHDRVLFILEQTRMGMLPPRSPHHPKNLPVRQPARVVHGQIITSGRKCLAIAWRGSLDTEVRHARRTVRWVTRYCRSHGGAHGSARARTHGHAAEPRRDATGGGSVRKALKVSFLRYREF